MGYDFNFGRWNDPLPTVIRIGPTNGDSWYKRFQDPQVLMLELDYVIANAYKRKWARDITGRMVRIDRIAGNDISDWIQKSITSIGYCTIFQVNSSIQSISSYLFRE